MRLDVGKFFYLNLIIFVMFNTFLQSYCNSTLVKSSFLPVEKICQKWFDQGELIKAFYKYCLQTYIISLIGSKFKKTLSNSILADFHAIPAFTEVSSSLSGRLLLRSLRRHKFCHRRELRRHQPIHGRTGQIFKLYQV